jgi:autotransporter-associated beta strand protein
MTNSRRAAFLGSQLPAILAILAATTITPAVNAATWTGAGTNDNWTTPANWGGTAPIPPEALTFAGAIRLTPNNDFPSAPATHFGGIIFDPSAGPFVLGGNAVALDGDIDDQSINPQIINLGISLPTSRAINVIDAGNLTINGSISSAGLISGVTKTGNGTLTLGGVNSYSGATVIDGGTLVYAVDNSANAVAFGAAPTAASASANVSTLDLDAGGLAATSLTVQTNSATANNIFIGAGKALTVNGTVTIGVGTIFSDANGGANTVLNVSGSGSLVANTAAGHFAVGVGRNNTGPPGNDPIAALDLSGLGNFTHTATTGQLRVGGGNVRATLTLANTSNTITAAAVRIGDSGVSGPGNNNAGRSIIHLGAGANVINTTALVIGETKSAGTLDFSGPTGTLTIAGPSGGASTANIQIGSSSNATGSGDVSMLLLDGHDVTVHGGTVVIGRLAGGTGGNSARGMVTFDTGAFNADSLQLGVSSTGSSTSGATGTFILGGPNPDSGATGVLNVANQFFLANRTNSAGGPVSGNFIISGGTANINTDIIDASTTGDRTTAITLAGGTLNMNGNDIGSAAAPITNVTLLSGTLSNAATVAARNIALGATTILPAQTTYFIDSSSGNGLLDASSRGTLTLGAGGGIHGGGTVAGEIVAASGSRIAPGTDSAAGTLVFSNSLTLNGGSTTRLRLSDNPGSGNDQIQTFGNLNLSGTVNLDIGALGLGPQIGNTYTLFSYSGALTGNQTNFAVTGPLSQSRLTFTVVPTATTPNVINISVGGSGAVDLRWIGNVNNRWNVVGDANWQNTATAAQERFFNLDTVTFDDTSINPNDVELVGPLQPGSVTVNATRNYKFAGAGSIVGGASLTKGGGGTLTIATNNTYAGSTDVNAGTLQVGEGGTSGSLGSGAINNNSILVYNRSDSITLTNVIAGGGEVRQNGGGTLTLSSANTYAGGLTVNSGAVRLGNATAQGAGPIAVNGGTLVLPGNLSNPITLNGGTLGTSTATTNNGMSGDLTVTAPSTVVIGDPQNLATAADMILTGNLIGSGNINVLASTSITNTDAAPGFRLRGTGPANYSGTITLNNRVKGELQTSEAGTFSPAGTGKFVLVGGAFDGGGSLNGTYSILNLRNNNGDINTIFANDVEMSGPGFASLNPLSNGTTTTTITMGNLRIGNGQHLGVNRTTAPTSIVHFVGATLTGGIATLSPRTPGFGAGVGSDLSIGHISETAPSGIIMGGLATLSFTGAANYTGATTVASGTLRIASTGNLTNSSPVTVATGATFAVEGTASVGPIAGDGSMSVTGAGQLTANHVRQGSLTVTGAGSKVTVRPNGGDPGASNVGAIDINSDGVLDLTNNDLVIRATAATKDTVHGEAEADIFRAQNGVDDSFITRWDGPGITSASARTANVAAGFDLTALGVIRNSDLDITTGVPGSTYGNFSGQAVTPDDVLVKYTYTGDGNLDGAVTFDDYAAMDSAFFGLIPNLGWATGDINFDTQITFDDYSVVDQAFFFQGAPLSGDAGGVAAVPEPGTLVLLLACLGAMIAVGHSRRSRTR